MRLAYGKKGLEVEVPDNITLIEPAFVLGIPDEEEAIRKSLVAPIGCKPLRDLAKGKASAAIVVSDITRPVPSFRLLPPLSDELHGAGIKREKIKIIVATGSHRPNTIEELVGMVGESIVKEYQVVNHNAFDPAGLVSIGKNRFGNEVWINREYMESEVKILTGFIEPHFFAGFSGGRKAVFPGIVGQQNLRSNHGAAMIDHPKARYGILEGNPIHEEMLDTASMTRPDFIINVSLNEKHEITGVFAGDLVKAHVGCRIRGLP